MTYVPPQQILERYAHLIVQAGLGEGEGIRPGATVIVSGGEDSKPLYYEVCREVWRQGGNVIHAFRPEDDGDYNFTAAYYALAGDEQLAHINENYTRGRFEDADHQVFIMGERNPTAAKDVDPRQRAKEAPMLARYWELRQAQERAGRFGWTLLLWGTDALAAEAGMTIEAYWEQIIAACHLDDADPVARWKETIDAIHIYRDWLNGLDIDRLHIEAAGTDLWLTLGESRRWVGGDGMNLPGFEIFTSPDWRGTDGTITFTEPLYYEGTLLHDVALEFKGGEVVRADASEGAEQLRAMVSMTGGNRVGEFSMTDRRLSRITRFMADTLYDENMGGPYGNTHIAIGAAYTECFDGEEDGVEDAEWERLGFNVGAAIHCDIVSTSDRTITATLRDGSTRVIYADGQFQTD